MGAVAAAAMSTSGPGGEKAIAFRKNRPEAPMPRVETKRSRTRASRSSEQVDMQ
jgi:hypothetical protein